MPFAVLETVYAPAGMVVPLTVKLKGTSARIAFDCAAAEPAANSRPSTPTRLRTCLFIVPPFVRTAEAKQNRPSFQHDQHVREAVSHPVSVLITECAQTKHAACQAHRFTRVSGLWTRKSMMPKSFRGKGQSSRRGPVTLAA